MANGHMSELLDPDAEGRVVEPDAHFPAWISHRRDAAGDQADYNYLLYRFNGDGTHMLAKVYLDVASVAMVSGPFVGEGSTARLVQDEALRAGVLAYLNRRFREVHLSNG